MGSWMLIVVGLAALIAGAELVLRAGTRLAARLGVSPLVIGLTVVSIGTSAPELAVGVDAVWVGAGDLAVGNIAGTNLVNLLLILGLSALLRPLTLHGQILRFDLPMMALAAISLLLMTLDRTLSRTDGVLLVAIALIYTAVILRVSRRELASVRAEYEAEYAPPPRPSPKGKLVDIVLLVAGIAVVVLGAHGLVGGSVDLAQQLGVSDALIGLTIVSIGTSAPELVTTLVATVRNDRDVAVGNLIGSSVYNIAFILGVTTLTAPGGITVSEQLVQVDLPLMTAAVLLCIPVFLSGRRVHRFEGGLFVVLYLGYLLWLLTTRT
ncbi:sodium:calcium antiporter (plasmid) [Arthrobacter sp. U41]|nr:sodium:calcium antiporter [Arthrobacter sp. U41]AOT06014.1 sodium:calcium antiporter [Arthrobacter sp. U41]